MTDEQEDMLDEIESNKEPLPINSDIEEQLASSCDRQLILSFLERRSIEMGATERIENFCSKLQKQGKSSFLEMRNEVLKSFDSLTPRPLRLEILQMAMEFVDESISTHTNKDEHQGDSSSSNEPFPFSDNSTTSASSSIETCTEIINLN